MKTIACSCFLVFALLCSFTLVAQEEGSLGFSFNTNTVYNRLNKNNYIHCTVIEVLTHGPADKAKFHPIGDMVYSINGERVFIPQDSIGDFTSYNDFIKSKLKCRAGDVVEITTLDTYFLEKVWHGGFEFDGLPEKRFEKKYRIIAESKAEIDEKWKEYEKYWNDDYKSYQTSPETKKILKIKKNQIATLSNPKFASDFSHYVDNIYLLIDTSISHPINREYVRNVLEKKGYNVYFLEYGAKSDPRTLFANNSIPSLKLTAAIEIVCGVEKRTDNYSMDVSREYARYVDNHGNSITEYRPQKEKWSVTKKEINGYLYVTLPRRDSYLYDFVAPLQYVYKKPFKITTGKENWADVALKTIMAEIPDKK